jgi:hypothetical protein
MLVAHRTLPKSRVYQHVTDPEPSRAFHHSAGAAIPGLGRTRDPRISWTEGIQGDRAAARVPAQVIEPPQSRTVRRGSLNHRQTPMAVFTVAVPGLAPLDESELGPRAAPLW